MEKIKTLLINNTAPQWVEAILFIAGGIIAGIIFSTIITTLIKKFTARTKTIIDDIIAEHIKTPVALLFILGGCAMGLSKLSLRPESVVLKNKIFFALFVFIISWSIMKIIDAFIAHYAPPVLPDSENKNKPLILPGGETLKSFQTDFKPVLRRLVSIVMVILPLVIVAKSFGYDISAILAGLGIGGAALALAARDILASFFGSIAILADKPFHVGDRIRFIDKNYENIDGFITEIRFRTTRLKTLDNRIVAIPNSIFSAMPVQNVSSEPHTKVLQYITIRSSNGSEKTQRAVTLLKTLAPPDIQFGSPHLVFVSSVGITVYKITFIFFIAKDCDYFESINAVNLEIIRQFEAAGILL